MAPRWRLAAPHYLNVPGVSWEYKEVDRTSGKQVRRTFPVPQLLDPDQPADWSHTYGRDQGEIIVAYEGTDDPKDVVFVGEPTPDMVPMNDEAKKISAGFAAKWNHPIESLSGSYADSVMNQLQAEVAEARAKTASNKIEGIDELLTAMTAMMKQNQQLLEAVLRPKAEDKARRA